MNMGVDPQAVFDETNNNHHNHNYSSANNYDNVPEKSKIWGLKQIFKKTALLVLSQWLIIGMGIACLLAYLFPDVAKKGGTIKSQYSILYGAVGLVFLISGLSIPRKKLYTHMFNWRLHGVVQVTSFLFVPAVVLAVVHLIIATDPEQKIEPAILAGYILTSSIPTTIASNVVMTRSAGGDDAAALVEVLIANFLGPFMTAAWTEALMPKTAEFGPWTSESSKMTSMYRDVFKQLGLSALLPLVVGQLIRWTWEEQVGMILQRFYITKINTFCMILLVWTTFSSAFATGSLEALTTESIVFTVLFNVALYLFLTLICFSLARPPRCLRKKTNSWGGRLFRAMPPEEAIAVCFCGPAKTTALGIPLLYAMFDSMDLYTKSNTSIPVLLYTTEQIFVAHFMVYVLRWWRERLGEKRDGERVTPEGDP